MMKTVKTAPALLLAALLAGCTATSNTADSDAPGREAPEADVATAEPAEETATASEPVVAEREVPIPDASVYPLLRAEFALRDRKYDEALEILFKQSLLLDDPAVTRKTLKLAEFRRRDDLTLKLAERLTALDPEDATAPVAAMTLNARAGNVDAALFYAREAKNRGARINAPSLLLNLESLPPARQAAVVNAIETLARDYPDDIDIAIARALAKRSQRDLEGSLAVLDDILAEQPTEERALVLWTQIQADRGAEDPYERMRSVLADEAAEESLRLQYARLLATTGQFDLAREQFLILQQMSPRNGDYLVSLALIEFEQKNFGAAAKQLRALIALGQRVDEAWYYLGRIAEELFDINAALEAYKQVGPGREFLDAKRRAADLILDDGDIDAYAQAFTLARRQSPGEAERLFLLQADLLRDRDNLDGAIGVYTEALSVFPDSLSLQYGRAMALETTGDIGGMEQDLRAILEREPDNATTLNALGYTLSLHTERYDEAKQLIERALEISPDDAAIMDSLGWVYFKLGNLDEALRYLQQAYQLLQDPEVAAHLGETLWAMGREEDARVIWRGALMRDPQNDIVVETIRRLGVALDGPGS